MRLIVALAVILALASPAFATTYTGVGDGVTDNTATFNAAVAGVCVSSATRTLAIPVGRYRFASAPAPIPCALNLVGEGPAVTVLIRDFPGAQLIKWVGGQDPYGGGSIRDISLDAGTQTGGIGLWVQAQLETDPTVQSKNPHGLVIDNVFVVAAATYPNSGSWNYGVYIDGALNANPPAGVAPGMRFVRMFRVSVSRFTILPYLIDYGYGTRMVDCDCWIPIGSGSPVVWVQHDNGATYVMATPQCPLSVH